MDDVLPRHVMCILGNWKSFDEVDQIVSSFEGFSFEREYSQLEPDLRMTAAFRMWLDPMASTGDQDDLTSIENHKAVAYVLSPPLERGGEKAVSGQMLQLTSALLESESGVAAKSESAGIAHGRNQWLDLAAKYADIKNGQNEHTALSALFTAWVKRGIEDAKHGIIYSCGMHLLGEPDIEIDGSIGAVDAHMWQSLCGLHIVADRPKPPLREGDGFRLDHSSSRRIVRHVPCTRYEDDDFFFNPFGYFRLEPDVKQ